MSVSQWTYGKQKPSRIANTYRENTLFQLMLALSGRIPGPKYVRLNGCHGEYIEKNTKKQDMRSWIAPKSLPPFQNFNKIDIRL